MKAKLIISIDDEQFQETEVELFAQTKYENLSPALIARRLEDSVTINEKRVRQEISKTINDHPMRFANACGWEAFLQVPSRMNENPITTEQCQKDLLTLRNGKSLL